MWAPLIEAFANLLLPLAVALFAVFFVKSRLAEGLTSALKFSDVFATAFLGLVCWAFNKYLESVNRRFDASDTAVNRRFDAIDAALRGLMQSPPSVAR